MAGGRNGAMIGALATIVAACIGAGVTLAVWNADRNDDGPGPVVTEPGGGDPKFKTAKVFANRTSAPAGTEVTVSGQGFDPGEEVVIRVHTREVGRVTAGADGAFAGVEITIPDDLFTDQQYDIIATGGSSVRSARTPIQVT